MDQTRLQIGRRLTMNAKSFKPTNFFDRFSCSLVVKLDAVYLNSCCVRIAIQIGQISLRPIMTGNEV